MTEGRGSGYFPALGSGGEELLVQRLLCLVIIWINGLFGAGKSSTAEAVVARLGAAQIVDPEEIGFGLPTWHGNGGDLDDIQHDPRWRTLTVESVIAVEEAFGTAVVPMTLFIPEYFDEIVGGLRRAGHDLRHFTLRVGPDIALARGSTRPDGLDTWALPRNQMYNACLTDQRFAEFIDSEPLTVDEVVDHVLQAVT